MEVIKRFLILFISLTFFTACHNMCTDLEDVIGSTCWSDKLYWEDVSKRTFSFSGTDKFEMTSEDGESVVKAVSGNGNWLFSSLGRDIKGYEVQIKCSANTDLAGCQLFSKSDYRAFEVYITKNGSIDVRYQNKDGKDIKLYLSSKMIDDITKYNTISLVLQDDRNVKVFCNGKYVYTITGYSLDYGVLAIQRKSYDNTYYKIKKVMH